MVAVVSDRLEYISANDGFIEITPYACAFAAIAKIVCLERGQVMSWSIIPDEFGKAVDAISGIRTIPTVIGSAVLALINLTVSFVEVATYFS